MDNSKSSDDTTFYDIKIVALSNERPFGYENAYTSYGYLIVSDDYMNQLHQEYPVYDWDHNKGYPTKKHRAAIAAHGISPYHRKSYNLLGNGQLTLDLF